MRPLSLIALAGFTLVAPSLTLYACGTSEGDGAANAFSPDGNVPGEGGGEGSIAPEGGGSDATGVVPPPKPLYVTGLGAGSQHACAIRSDGTVACWGENVSFDLGVEDAGSLNVSTPVTAAELTGALSVIGTFASSCALLDTGVLACWGSNSGGLLGNIAAPSSSFKATKAGELVDVVAATGGEKHACLLRAGGKAYCWGNNDDEQLGSGIAGAGNSGAPAAVQQLEENLKYIGSGATSRHTCAIRSDDQVVCWGLNSQTGQLGAPTFHEARSPLPLLVDNVQDAIKVATGRDHSCAILKGGKVKCWGANQFGQAGSGTPAAGATVPTATEVPNITDAVALSLGDQRTCIVHASGKVSCFGNNPNGALGGGTAAAFSVTPVDVTAIADAQDVSLGEGFSCVLRAGGKVSCWGVNGKSQLGAGANDAGAFSSTPIEVAGF